MVLDFSIDADRENLLLVFSSRWNLALLIWGLQQLKNITGLLIILLRSKIWDHRSKVFKMALGSFYEKPPPTSAELRRLKVGTRDPKSVNHDAENHHIRSSLKKYWVSLWALLCDKHGSSSALDTVPALKSPTIWQSDVNTLIMYATWHMLKHVMWEPPKRNQGTIDLYREVTMDCILNGM